MMRALRRHRPDTIHGWVLLIARVVWVVLAAFGVYVFIATLPIYYQHALSMHGDHCCVTRNPAEWRAGLRQLHLTPTIFAGYAVGSQIVLSTAMFVIGLVIFLRKSNQWIGLFISLELVSFGLVSANTEPVGFPAWMKVAADAYNNTAFLAFAFIPLVFPNGRFVPRWSVALVGVVAVALGLGPFVAGTPLDSNNWPGIVNLALTVFVLGTILLAPIYRYVRVSDRVEREQTKWVMFTLVLAIGVFLLAGGLIPSIEGIPAHPVQAVLVDMATQTAMGLAFLLVPVGFAVAILRYKLWDIDTLINRTLVYGSLTISLVALYIGAVIATLAVAAIFNPWRHRVQTFIDRRFYRHKYDAGRVLAGFSAKLRDEVDLDQLTGDLLSVAHDAVQPASAVLWLREREGTT